MARSKNTVARKARHKKWIKRAKGYRGSRSRVFKRAKEAVLKAGQHAYHDRRKKKSVKRAAWQSHINAAARQHNLSYSRLIHGLRQTNIALDRKILAQLVREHPAIFKKIVEAIKNKK
ncbi:MAG: 50S ribosomal protein L20 [bacterium]